MKRFLKATAACALVLALVSCSNGSDSKSDSDGEAKDNGAKGSIATVKVTGATFTGSDENKLWNYEGAFTAERSITVKDFYIGKYEITKDEYKAVMAGNDLVADADGWRLPTEIEWEYAARGGVTSAAAWNFEYAGKKSNLASSDSKDSALDAVGWYWYNTASGITADTAPSSGTPGYGAHQVGLKEPNTLGIRDMSGNVWEWCYDWYSAIDAGTPLDGPSAGSDRVIRGGSWESRAIVRGRTKFNCANFACVAFRNNEGTNDRRYSLGFRVVRSAQ